MLKFLKFTAVLSFFLAAAFSNPVYSLDLVGSPDIENAQIGDPDVPEFPFTPSDGIFISAFPDTGSFLNGIYAIDDRGFAEFPILGKVNVGIMKRDELVKFLQEKYKTFLKYPDIYVKPMVRVSLLGGFLQPGLYYVDINSSLWDVVGKAGGTLLEEGIYDMKWERNTKKQTKKLVQHFETGISLKKMGFRSGDQIWTPSPARRTIWDTIGNVLPVLTFATTLFVIYNSYQRDQILLRAR